MSGENKNNQLGYDPNMFDESIRRSQDIRFEEMDNAVEAAKAEELEKVTNSTRDAVAKTPMGPELKGAEAPAPTLEEDDRSPEAEGIPVVDGVVQRHPYDDRSI